MHADSSAFRSEFNRIRKQSVDHLFDPSLVQDQIFAEFDGGLKIESFIENQRMQNSGNLGDGFSQGKWLGRELDFACFNFREVEQVIDQTEQVAAAIWNIAEIFFLFGVQR